ncbi:MAG: hypothetical protein JSS20_18115, partial [Proteobacteria bacterium]|nr:hypothetical protein [Pseudomonadota bacterium]
KVAKDIGCIAPYSITNVGPRIFFLSAQGWIMTDTTGATQYIGQEKIDRTFLDDYDTSNLQLVMTAGDPQAAVLYVAYKSAASSTTYADKGLVYNWLLNRWAPWSINTEFLASAVRPGLTLEGLDAIAPGAQSVTGAADNGSGLIRLTVDSTSGWTTGNSKTVSSVGGVTAANGTWTITVVDGTHIDLQGSAFSGSYTSGGLVGGSIDLMTISLDAYATVSNAAVAAFDTSHKLGFLNGDNLEATLESAEQDGKGQRILVQGFRPITDSPAVYGSIGYRENLNASRSYTPEVAMNAYGNVTTMRSTRYARAKLRIPSGAAWTFASGVQPDAQEDGYA